MSQPLAYEFQTTRNYAIIEFTPVLDDCRWGDIERIGQELKDRLAGLQAPVFLLDLSRLQFISSSVVALVVRLWKSVQEPGGGMVVVNSNAMIQSVLEIAGLTRVWTIVPTREEAQRVLSLPPYCAPQNADRFLLAILGWVAAAGAVGLILMQEKQLGSMSPDTSRTIALVSGVVAIVLGFVSALRGRRQWRFLGVLLVLISGAVVTVAALGLSGQSPT